MIGGMKPSRPHDDAPESELPPGAFARYDDTPDEEFYRPSRLVTHIDPAAIAYVTDLYRKVIPRGGAVLDLMSSWVSHLPPEVAYSKVVGLGMNREELRANPRLTERVVQNLNTDPRLLFGDAEFDTVLVCVSVQYLTAPVEVLREVARILRDRASVVISFSNRCFPTKAVAVWQALDDAGHVRLVEHYLREAGGFDVIDLHVKPAKSNEDPLYAVVGRKTG
jgi:SAM-dependent methyltransferase